MQEERSWFAAKRSMAIASGAVDAGLRKGTPPPDFSQVFILKGLKVLCFDTLLQVFILKVVSPPIDPFGLEMTMNRARLVKCGDHGLD